MKTEVDCKAGLNKKQIADRINEGKQNIVQSNITKTKGQIIKSNVFTLFNLLNLLIAVALAAVGAWSNMIFISIILMNIIIGIAQELKAKKLVEELSLLSMPTVTVIRDCEEQTVTVEEIVQDDIMLLESGKQISCDSVVMEGELEVNESLLTGESDSVIKRAGDRLLSGSSVICGKCYAQVEHVGNENYAAKISEEAKKMRSVNSELMNSMKKVTKITSFLIIPLGIILFAEAFFLRGDTTFSAVVSSAAGLLGMLPKGLVLLISISLAGGVIKLAKQKVLIQDLYSLESLAHVDILCLDKTGTLTEGKMQVSRTYDLGKENGMEADFSRIMGSFLHHSDDNNATFQALKEYYQEEDAYGVIRKIPFSSQRKWSAITFEGAGTFVVGAPERLLAGRIPGYLQKEIEHGKRVIIAGITGETVQPDEDLTKVQPLMAVVINDKVRENASETLRYFRKEGVEIKIISGDNPAAVSSIGKEAGLANYRAYIDMSTIGEDADLTQITSQYTVFGRTTPLQKKQLLQAMKEQGHSVAMTGDGVNDLLALKEADCSIAVAEGSDAAKQVAQVVLLDSDFSSLPDVLLEGRRVVNNVTRVAGVFFIKTIYSVLLTIICILLNAPFPFIPIQITLIDAAIEAYPAFLTAFEPNGNKVGERFLPAAFRRAVPNAIAIVFGVLAVYLAAPLLGIGAGQMNTTAYLLVAIVSIAAVIRSSAPFTKLRVFVCSTMTFGFLAAITLFHSLLKIERLSFDAIMLLGFVSVGALLLERIVAMIIHIIQGKNAAGTISGRKQSVGGN